MRVVKFASTDGWNHGALIPDSTTTPSNIVDAAVVSKLQPGTLENPPEPERKEQHKKMSKRERKNETS